MCVRLCFARTSSCRCPRFSRAVRALTTEGIKIFFNVSERAGYLFAPTAAWVTVATALQVGGCWDCWLLIRYLYVVVVVGGGGCVCFY